MSKFNADGSEAEMCGNGLRCVAKFVSDQKISSDSEIKIETAVGIRAAKIVESSGLDSRVSVEMGTPGLEAREIPTTIPTKSDNGQVVCQPLEVDGQTLEVTCVSMGTPHCVVFVEEATDELVLGLGPKLENHPMFPSRTNVEFVEIKSPGKVRQRTWERGSGETLACGSGACGVCVAGV